MPPFERGAVVSRGGRVGVVWSDGPSGLVLLPVEDGQFHAHDVPIADCLSCGFAIEGARVRSRRMPPMARHGQTQIGTVPPPLMGQIVQAVVRREADQMTVARWERPVLHRQFLAESCKSRR